VRQNNLAKRLGYRKGSNGQPVMGEPEQLCLQPLDMRRIVETHRHSRGSRKRCTAKFPPPDLLEYRPSKRGLYQPHTDKATVSGTGTLPPSSCGKGPNAVGESVMTLPGKPLRDAARLVCKGHDLSLWWQSRHSSRSAGRPRTGRRTAVQGTVEIRRLWNSRFLPLMANRLVGSHGSRSVRKDSLGGKAGCGESRPSGLEGGFTKPLMET